MPAGKRGNEVADAVAVQAAGEEHAGETLPDGVAEVGLFLVIDLKMGRDGPVEALGGEDGLAVAWAHRLGGGGASNLEGGLLLEGGEGGREEDGGLGGCWTVTRQLLSRCTCEGANGD